MARWCALACCLPVRRGYIVGRMLNSMNPVSCGRVVVRLVLLLVLALGCGGKAMAMDTVLEQLRGRLPADATVVAAMAGQVNVGLADGATVHMVPAGDGAPFSESCEVVVPKAYERTFDVCAHSTPFAAAVPKGHRVLMSIWLRAPKMTGGRTGTVIICLEKCVDPWTAVAGSSATIGPDWRQVIVQA